MSRGDKSMMIIYGSDTSLESFFCKHRVNHTEGILGFFKKAWLSDLHKKTFIGRSYGKKLLHAWELLFWSNVSSSLCDAKFVAIVDLSPSTWLLVAFQCINAHSRIEQPQAKRYEHMVEKNEEKKISFFTHFFFIETVLLVWYLK